MCTNIFGLNIELVPIINVFLTAIIALLVSWVQFKKGKVISYTGAEKRALEGKTIEPKELSDYHSNISWGSYSVLLVSLFCVLVSILYVEADPVTSCERNIFTFAALEMGVAATILIFSDLVHMNGISPVVSSGDRHRIVNSSIKAGVLSIVILLAGMQTFAILISATTMYILCLIEILAVGYFAWIRPISKTSWKHRS